jgi:hypothetical protein
MFSILQAFRHNIFFHTSNINDQPAELVSLACEGIVNHVETNDNPILFNRPNKIRSVRFNADQTEPKFDLD